MVILDTNAVSALFEGEPALAQGLAHANNHQPPAIVIGKYRYGLLRSRHRRKLSVLLYSLVRESVVLRVDETTAHAYAEVRDELRALGRPIPENDVWIAALARQHGEAVVSRERHFECCGRPTRHHLVAVGKAKSPLFKTCTMTRVRPQLEGVVAKHWRP